MGTTNLEATLKCLLDACETMRDTSGYHRGKRTQLVTESQWSSWCKQVKDAKKGYTDYGS